jgi:formate C-acetyltransferase
MSAGKSGTAYRIMEPKNLSPRISFLRNYYFEGAGRKWNNEYTAWTTGTPWDIQYFEPSYYIVPEVYMLIDALGGSFRQAARPVETAPGFWRMGLAERRAWFLREVFDRYLPVEILPGDLLCGARFNLQTSMCLTKRETKEYLKAIKGPKGARADMKWFHNHGYGNAGATSGHLVPGYETVLRIGWRGVHENLQKTLAALPEAEKNGYRGSQLRAMMTAAEIPAKLAPRYAALCRELERAESDRTRRDELSVMAAMMERIPWEPPRTFWEAVEALWMTHMLVMSDENYPGPGVSFGRVDQYLLPFFERSMNEGMDRDFAKEILKCFWIHCNTAYDAQIRTGNQGITAGFGQLLTLSGLGRGNKDMTNDLTYLFLEVIDEMSPILEPKPNVRIHRKSPDRLLETLTAQIVRAQGAPFILNFDERSMAGMLLEGKRGGYESLINPDTVYDYAPVGCLENTMVGNDRSGTVDCNLNLLKAVELAINAGRDLVPFTDPMTGKDEPIGQDGPRTPNPEELTTWESFWDAYVTQTRYIVKRCVDLYERSERVRARFFRTPYLSCLVEGCAEQGLDVTQGGARIGFVTMEGVTYATTVDSLLAVKYLVYDEKLCTLPELRKALRDNWVGHEVLQARAKHKAPKYGRDDDAADALGKAVMDLFCEETWKYRTRSTGRRFRPGMLSWNYWAGDGFIMAASADGRLKGQFLSNAICPSNGADINGPTANANSVGKVLGGRTTAGSGEDWEGYLNSLPNGASHTITFNPSILRDPEHRGKFISFLRGYAENGGTALQINMLDPGMLMEAQKHPSDFRHLLVRVTGYNAYFTTIGRELQDEVIHRVSHGKF